MLALVVGCASEVARRRLVSHVGIKGQIAAIKKEAETCINSWDETGNGPKNTKQIEQWYQQWDQQYFDQAERHNQSATELISICDHLLTDLLNLLKVPWKRRMIEALHSQVQDVYTWLDSDWRNLPALESAGRGVGSLENIINN